MIYWPAFLMSVVLFCLAGTHTSGMIYWPAFHLSCGPFLSCWNPQFRDDLLAYLPCVLWSFLSCWNPHFRDDLLACLPHVLDTAVYILSQFQSLSLSCMGRCSLDLLVFGAMLSPILWRCKRARPVVQFTRLGVFGLQPSFRIQTSFGKHQKWQ